MSNKFVTLRVLASVNQRLKRVPGGTITKTTILSATANPSAARTSWASAMRTAPAS